MRASRGSANTITDAATLPSEAKWVLYLLSVGLVGLLPVDMWYKSYRYSPLHVAPIPQAIRAILLLVMLVFLFRAGSHPRTRGVLFNRILGLWGVLLCFHTVVTAQALTFAFYYSVRQFFWMAGALTFYRLGLMGYVRLEYLWRLLGAVVLVASIVTLRLMLGPDAVPGQNAGDYVILWCLPLLLLRASLLRTLVVMVGSVAVLATVKRGSALGVAVGFLAYALTSLYIHRRASVGLKPILVGVAVCLVFAAGFAWQYQHFQTRLDEFHEDNVDEFGSGRVGVARQLMKRWIDAPMMTKVVGFGIMAEFLYFQGLRVQGGLVAHSTAMATLHNYGLVGAVLLLAFHYAILQVLYRGLVLRHGLTPALIMSYVSSLLSQLYTNCFFDPTTIYFGITVMFCMAQIVGCRSSAALPIVLPRQPSSHSGR